MWLRNGREGTCHLDNGLCIVHKGVISMLIDLTALSIDNN